MREPKALLILFFLAGPCCAQGITAPGVDPAALGGRTQVQTGSVTYVDPVTMNFVCRDKTASRRYWATRATRFGAGRPGASFFDLAPGQTVQVTSHLSGRIDVADQVILLPRS
jgi:hypothetical protein